MKIGTTHRGFLLLLFTVVLIFSCEKTPLEGVQILVDTEFIPNSVDIGIFDALTGEPIDNPVPNISFSVSDRNVDAKVFEISGGALEVTGGFISVAIKPDASADFGTEALLFEGGISIDAEGYLPTSVPILLYESSKQALKVFLAKADALPPGITRTSELDPLGPNGILQNTLQVQTSTTLGGSATLIIPAGSVIKGEDGNPLNASSIMATINHFSPSAGDDLPDAFPGGLITRVEKNGAVYTTAFATAGLVGIEVTSGNGNIPAACINTVFDVNMEIPSDIVNPETGMPIQVGDMIPLWYLEPNLSIWKAQGSVPVIMNMNGDLQATFSSSLLGYYNLDWEYPNEGCTEGGQLILNSTIAGDTSPVFGVLKLKIDNQLLRSEYISGKFGDTIPLPLVPKENMTVELCDYDGTLLGSQTADFCGRTSQFTLSPITNEDCSNVFVAGFCPANPELLFKPTIGYWYREEPAGDWIAGSMVNGQATFCGEIGKNYTVALAFDGAIRDSTFTYDTSLDLDFGELNLGDTKYCD